MLSNKEKQEMREFATSEAIREEFRLLRKHSLRFQPAILDHYIRFLTVMSRLYPKPIQPRAFVKYTQVKL